MTQSQGSEQKENSGGYLPILLVGMISGIMAVYLFQALMLLISEMVNQSSIKYGRSAEPLQSFQLRAKMSGRELATWLETSLKDMEPGTLVYLWLMNSPTSSDLDGSETSSNGSHVTDEKEIVDLSQALRDHEKST